MPGATKDRLIFTWKAIYTDGTFLDQFGEMDHHFGHIDLSRLARLELHHKLGQSSFAVDLTTGLFYINNTLTTEINNQPLGFDYSTKEHQVKPILFRRVKNIFSPGNPNIQVIVVYFLGWEGTVQGQFQKHGLQIFEDSTFSLPPQDGFHAI